jgi:hypothetical protein
MSKNRWALLSVKIALPAALTVAAFFSPLGEYLWLLSGLIPLLLAAASIGCILFAIANWASQRRLVFLVGALMFAALSIFLKLNPNFTRDVRFALHRASYEEKVRIILQTKAEGRDIDKLKISDLAYIDDGPPVRVSFFWFRGVTDNWVGLVFDPSGDVMKVNQLRAEKRKWDDPKFQGISMLFGGELYHAEHLSGHWYLCGFT